MPAVTRLSKIGGFYLPSTPGDQAKNASMKQKDVSYLLIQIRWLTKNYTSAYFSIVHTALIAEASDFLFLGVWRGAKAALACPLLYCAACRNFERTIIQAGIASVRPATRTVRCRSSILASLNFSFPRSHQLQSEARAASPQFPQRQSGGSRAHIDANTNPLLAFSHGRTMLLRLVSPSCGLPEKELCTRIGIDNSLDRPIFGTLDRSTQNASRSSPLYVDHAFSD